MFDSCVLCPEPMVLKSKIHGQKKVVMAQKSERKKTPKAKALYAPKGPTWEFGSRH